MSRRRLPLLTASVLDRARACPASFGLPQTREAPRSHTATGTAVHAFVARARVAGRDEALGEISRDAEHRVFCENLPLDRLPQGGRAEVAFAYDVEQDTARELRTSDRRYDVTDTEIAGTADLVGLVDGGAYVADWKTGFADLPPAREAMQLRFLGLAAARVFGVDSAKVEFFRLREDGSFWADSAVFDVFDLAEIADEARGIFERVEHAIGALWTADSQPPAVSMGDHCGYCPAFPSCPGQSSLARSLAQYTEPGELTIEEASRAWQTLDRYDEIAKRVRHSLREFAKLTPFSTGPGKELRLVDRNTTSLDLTIARSVLAERFGAEAAKEAVEEKITQAGVDDVIRVAASKSGARFTELKRAVYDELERRKGLMRGKRPEVRVSKAREAE